MPYAAKLAKPLLGPFRDPETGEEIIPATTEGTDDVVEMVLGTYGVASILRTLSGLSLAITPRLLTTFIQRDLNRVLSGRPPGKGFLIAYQGSRTAVGRMVEELIAARLMRRITWEGERAASILSVEEARERGWVVRPQRGVRSDDLVVRTRKGNLWLAEVKGSLRGSGYLVTSRPKAVAQLVSTLVTNPHVQMAYLVTVMMRDKTVQVEGKPRGDWLSGAHGGA